MIARMEDKTPPKETAIRIHHEVKLAFKRSRTALDEQPTQERTTEALWLWFARLPVEQAREFIRREFPLLDEYLRGGSPPAPEAPKGRMGKDLGKAESPRRTRRSG